MPRERFRVSEWIHFEEPMATAPTAHDSVHPCTVLCAPPGRRGNARLKSPREWRLDFASTLRIRRRRRRGSGRGRRRTGLAWRRAGRSGGRRVGSRSPVRRSPHPRGPVPDPLAGDVDERGRRTRGRRDVRRFDVAAGDSQSDADQQCESEAYAPARVPVRAAGSVHFLTGRTAARASAPKPSRSGRFGACGSRCAPRP